MRSALACKIPPPACSSPGPRPIRWSTPSRASRCCGSTTALLAELGSESPAYRVDTSPDDLALLQYTSGTTRALPEGISHTHRAVVTLMIAALYGVGLEPGDRYFCPSSPAWGHGLAHGTLSPLALGIAVGAYSGRFDAEPPA